MRELESMLQQFGEFLLKARLVKENAAPHCVGWVRRFLTAATTEGALADRARRFCEELESRSLPDWQVYLQSLCPVPSPMDHDTPAVIRLVAAPAAPASRPGAILGLLVLTAFVLWIAGFAIRRMQIAYGAET